jgi:very-short-patch-repair endonuclease
MLDVEDTRSRAERRFLKLVATAGLPGPEVNAAVGGWRPDFLWRDRRLVVEVDGYAAHSSPWAQERDRRKDLALRALGLDVIRFTARQVDGDPATVLTTTIEAYRRRAPR